MGTRLVISDVDAAVEATHLGADDFITRPIENEELVMRVAVTLKHHRTAVELESLRTQVAIAGFIRDLIEHTRAGSGSSQDASPMPLRTLRDAVVAQIEKMAIEQTIRLASGNKTAAACLLQVDVKTMYAKLRRYDLEIEPAAVSKPRPIGQ